MGDAAHGQTATRAPGSKGTRPIYDVVVNPLSLRAAPVVLLVTFVMPPGGLPITLCWFHAVTGLPCPGCGLTRSLASLSHGHLGDAFRYHPFGLVLYALFVGLTAAGLAGEARRARLRAWLEQRALAARSRAVYHGLVAAFLGFGLVRLGVAWLSNGRWFSGV